MPVVYKNKFGDTIVDKNSEPFDIRGTIMNVSVQRVNNHTVHRLWLEDGNGGKSVTIWDNAYGYNKDGLKSGFPVRVKGILHKQYYDSWGSGPKCFMDYRANEMQTL